MTRALAFVTIACALLACVVCCHRDDPAAHARATASKIEARLNERTAALTSTDPKRLFGERFDALVNVLGECSQAERDELLEAAAAAPGGNSKEGFPRAAISGLIMFYSHVGDRASLVRVLALAAPQNVGLSELQEFVVVADPKIPDAVTAFFDAFEVSKSPEAKAAIAGGLRRGFAFAGELPRDDAEFIGWARTWYEEHRGTYEPNPEYCMRNHELSVNGPEKNPLFKPR